MQPKLGDKVIWEVPIITGKYALLPDTVIPFMINEPLCPYVMEHGDTLILKGIYGSIETEEWGLKRRDCTSPFIRIIWRRDKKRK